ncbi:PTS system glucose-specific IIC component [Mycoplasmoides fastidiosum]|uniref:PTS system glucose-specific IIC component n=1 Tax=Mycoplasmoides fastidiosum TaxID=92758 RepID=A0ABU0LXX5_9BACT|nr:PTS transporter subunit EIIC [Mycoplasmoides fastidiosum]MDQ0513566.1 PTS system glucose-specific IIC component [Mycoplasmoides fastidiosum]UUD38011.1 PTS transporter subunit EIIC [Mycoplasmoides fastidiosum]
MRISSVKWFDNPQWKRVVDVTRSFLTQLSQALMLPIAVLPIAGLLLGIGGAIGANVHTATANGFAAFFKSISEVIFANIAILFGISVAIAFAQTNKIYAGFMMVIGYLVFNSLQSAFIHFDHQNQFQDILWFHKDSNIRYLVGSNLGITSMQTSIFGSIIIGGIVAFVLNRWSEIEVKYLNFFSGIRLVPILLMPLITGLTMLFLVIWPYVGQLIGIIGDRLATAPGGVDGLVYGMVARSLMPLGLHHILIAIAFQTELGGRLTLASVVEAGERLQITEIPEFQTLVAELQARNGLIIGDQNIWNFINGLPFNHLPTNATGQSLPVFNWFQTQLNVYAGRFTQDYPIYLGAIQGIGLAMILAAKKTYRKKAVAIIGSSMVVAFLTGITEPLEFSFLFVAPLFYYVIYVPLSGLAYMFMKLAGAHVGVGFARGFIDYIIYGAVPVQKGTQFYWAIVIALAMGVFSFVTMYFGAKKFGWKIPYSTDEQLSLIDKKTWTELKKTEPTEAIPTLVKAYGGFSNIQSITACATRLRIVVIDLNQLDTETIKQQGAVAVLVKGSSTQAIFGGRAQILANQMEQYRKQVTPPN